MELRSGGIWPSTATNFIYSIDLGGNITSSGNISASKHIKSNTLSASANIYAPNIGTGVDNTALTNMIEILGAGTGSNTTYSSAGDSAAVDIKADDGTNGGVLYSSYACDGDTLKALDLSDRIHYVYVAFADGNHEGGDTNPSDPPKIRVCVEFAGQD